MKLSLILFLSAHVGCRADGRGLAFAPGADGTDGPDNAFAQDAEEAFAQDAEEAFAQDAEEAFAQGDGDEADNAFNSENAFNADNAFNQEFANDCDAGRFIFTVPASTDGDDLMALCPCDLTDSLKSQLGVQNEEQFRDLLEVKMGDVQSIDMYFEDITGDHQLDKNYFDGGSNWNYEEEMDATSGAILRAWDAFGSSERILWPQAVDNFDECDARVAMCCFSDTLGSDDFAPNSKVCHHDLGNSATSSHIKDGYSLFTGADNAYCTAFAWPGDDTTDQTRYRGNMLFFASMYNGRFLEKQVKNVPSAPLCGCIEKMPVVSETECMRVESDPVIRFTITPDGIKARFDASLTFSHCEEESFLDHYATMASGEEIDELETANFRGNCEDVVSDYFNDKFLVSGSVPSLVDLSKWTQIVGHGDTYYPSKGETFFRNAIANSPNGIIYRYCPKCKDYQHFNHKHIYYKRLTAIPPTKEVDFLDLFMDNWFRTPANEMGTDFTLHSTYEDAVSGDNPWAFCNYDDTNVGFPRDCGPTRKSDSQWNRYTSSHWGHYGYTNSFYVEKGGPNMAF